MPTSIRVLAAITISVAAMTSFAAPAAGEPERNADSKPSVTVFEGQRYAYPFDNRLAGLRLTYVVDRQGQQDGVVYAYRTEKEAHTHLGITGDPIGTLGNADFYSDINGRGDWVAFGPNNGHGNLGNVGRGCFIICSGNWNDVISSLRTNGSATRVHQHSNMTGHYLYFGPWVSANLTDYLMPDGTNWNDQITSLWVYA